MILVTFKAFALESACHFEVRIVQSPSVSSRSSKYLDLYVGTYLAKGLGSLLPEVQPMVVLPRQPGSPKEQVLSTPQSIAHH